MKHNFVKLVAVIVTLSVAVVFLLMDKCGNSGKLDRLKGQHEEHSKVATLERQLKEEIINDQQEEIEKQDLLIAKTNKEVEIKNRLVSKLDSTIADLEDEFGNLEQQDAKIGNLLQQVEAWKEKFSLAQGIIADKDSDIFSINKKYEAQLIVSNQYKELYESSLGEIKILKDINKAQDWQIKKLRLTSNLKTGIVGLLVAATIYGLVK